MASENEPTASLARLKPFLADVDQHLSNVWEVTMRQQIARNNGEEYCKKFIVHGVNGLAHLTAERKTWMLRATSHAQQHQHDDEHCGVENDHSAQGAPALLADYLLKHTDVYRLAKTITDYVDSSSMGLFRKLDLEADQAMMDFSRATMEAMNKPDGDENQTRMIKETFDRLVDVLQQRLETLQKCAEAQAQSEATPSSKTEAPGPSSAKPSKQKKGKQQSAKAGSLTTAASDPVERQSSVALDSTDGATFGIAAPLKGAESDETKVVLEPEPSAKEKKMPEDLWKDQANDLCRVVSSTVTKWLESDSVLLKWLSDSESCNQLPDAEANRQKIEECSEKARYYFAQLNKLICEAEAKLNVLKAQTIEQLQKSGRVTDPVKYAKCLDVHNKALEGLREISQIRLVIFRPLVQATIRLYQWWVDSLGFITWWPRGCGWVMPSKVCAAINRAAAATTGSSSSIGSVGNGGIIAGEVGADGIAAVPVNVVGVSTEKKPQKKKKKSDKSIKLYGTICSNIEDAFLACCENHDKNWVVTACLQKHMTAIDQSAKQTPVSDQSSFAADLSDLDIDSMEFTSSKTPITGLRCVLPRSKRVTTVDVRISQGRAQWDAYLLKELQAYANDLGAFYQSKVRKITLREKLLQLVGGPNASYHEAKNCPKTAAGAQPGPQKADDHLIVDITQNDRAQSEALQLMKSMSVEVQGGVPCSECLASSTLDKLLSEHQRLKSTDDILRTRIRADTGLGLMFLAQHVQAVTGITVPWNTHELDIDIRGTAHFNQGIVTRIEIGEIKRNSSTYLVMTAAQQLLVRIGFLKAASLILREMARGQHALHTTSPSHAQFAGVVYCGPAGKPPFLRGSIALKFPTLLTEVGKQGIELSVFRFQ